MTDEEKSEYNKILNDPKNFPSDIANKAQKFLPKTLYRYRSFDTTYWEDEIFKGKIYLAQATKLNDPMDCLIYFDGSLMPPNCEFINRYKKIYNCTYEDIIYKLSDESNLRWIFESFRSDVRTASFCENNQSLLMWSHYANVHNGFCIKYNTEKFKPIMLGILYPIIYSSVKPDVFNELRDCTENTIVKALVNKAMEWEYEKEWRAVNKADKQYEFFQLDAIEAIYLGARSKEEDKEKVVKWAKGKSKKVFQMEVDLREYKLIARKII